MNKKGFSYLLWICTLILVTVALILFLVFVTDKDVKDKDFNNTWWDLIEDKKYAVKAPHTRINKTDIVVLDDRVIIKVDNSKKVGFKGTGSMIPVFKKGHHAIIVEPENESVLYIGDIIIFNEYEGNGTIIHRIISINYDEEGWFAVTRGEISNSQIDKVRFSYIKYVVVAIIY